MHYFVHVSNQALGKFFLLLFLIHYRPPGSTSISKDLCLEMIKGLSLESEPKQVISLKFQLVFRKLLTKFQILSIAHWIAELTIEDAPVVRFLGSYEAGKQEELDKAFKGTVIEKIIAKGEIALPMVFYLFIYFLLIIFSCYKFGKERLADQQMMIHLWINLSI